MSSPIYAFGTKNETKIVQIIEYFQLEYSITVCVTTDIDWGSGSDQSRFYTFLQMPLDLSDEQLTDFRRQFKIACWRLTGNKFYNEREYFLQAGDYTGLLQGILDTKAREYQYDNIISACSYVNSTNDQWRRESTAFVQWRDELWGPVTQAIEQMVTDGTNPTLDDWVASLPTYESFLALQQ